jgi:hypothetical protein
MDQRSGGCLCGAVRFTAGAIESHFHACHCGMCRRWSGGSPFFGVRCTQVEFEPGDALGRYASSSWAERGFCRTCGTTLFYFLRPTESYTMSVGCFDDQRGIDLALEIFIDRKPEGYALVGDHPRWTEAETFARLAPDDES